MVSKHTVIGLTSHSTRFKQQWCNYLFTIYCTTNDTSVIFLKSLGYYFWTFSLSQPSILCVCSFIELKEVLMAQRDSFQDFRVFMNLFATKLCELSVTGMIIRFQFLHPPQLLQNHSSFFSQRALICRFSQVEALLSKWLGS